MATRRRIGSQYMLIAPDGTKLVLDDGYRQGVMSVSGIGMAEVEYATIRGYQYPGEFVQSYSIDPRTIQIEWLYIGPHVKALRTMRDRLTTMLRVNRGVPITLRQVRPDGRRRDIFVYPQGGPQGGTDTQRGSTATVETLVLYANDPLFFDPLVVSADIDAVPSSGFGFPYSFPYSYGPAGFLGKDIIYSGAAISYPFITIRGPFSTLTITHLQTKANLFITQGLAANRTLTIDLNPLDVVIQNDLGVSYMDYIGKSDVVNFALFPAGEAIPGGVNGFTVSGVGQTGGTTVNFQYYERYLSL